MEKFDLYDYVLTEGHKLSKDELQRIVAEVVFAVYQDTKGSEYYRIMNAAIESINEYLDLELPQQTI